MNEPEYKLQVFEGPLDLLLHLIDKNKIDIYDIPIAEITDQYMEYLDEMRRADLNIMSEFIVMASTLLSIKSRMLLPKQETEDEEEEGDPREELVKQLLEYKMYKCFAEELRDLQENAGREMYKEETIPPDVEKYEVPVDVSELLDGVTLQKLNAVFQEVLTRQKNRVDPVRSKFGSIRKEEVSVEEKMDQLTSFSKEHKTYSFKNLLEQAQSKTEVIVTFLAVLELMKRQQIHVEQDGTFADIQITSLIVEAA